MVLNPDCIPSLGFIHSDGDVCTRQYQRRHDCPPGESGSTHGGNHFCNSPSRAGQLACFFWRISLGKRFSVDRRGGSWPYMPASSAAWAIRPDSTMSHPATAVYHGRRPSLYGFGEFGDQRTFYALEGCRFHGPHCPNSCRESVQCRDFLLSDLST
jgi:hypothetical protein